MYPAVGHTRYATASRRAWIALVALAGLVAVLLIISPPAHADVNFNVKGKWTCKNRGTSVPIAGARIELWHDISFWPDDKITTRHLGADGSYDIGIHADGNFGLYVKLVLDDDNGVNLENWYSPFTWDTQTDVEDSHSGVVNLGTWQIDHDGGNGTPKCAVWQGAHNAYVDYQKVIGSRPPDSNYLIDADYPCCGTPFTTTDTTRWPSNYDPRAGYSVNFHEFAHSFRHSFDGGTLHFLYDAARFGYPRTHTLCLQTNEGFAFNEGWAEYWARTPQSCPPNTSDFSYEGNVATALTSLEKCSTRPKMVAVLKQNPGTIHSYAEYKARCDALYGARPCIIRPTGAILEAEPTLSAQQLTGEVQTQISAQKKLIASLSRQMNSATTRARRPGRCTAGHCQAGLEKLIAPSALDAQIQQAKLVLGRLRDGLAAAQQAKLDPGTLQASTFVSKMASSRDQFDQANQKIIINGLQQSMHEIKTQPGYFKRGRSSKLFQTLNNRLSAINRTRKLRRDTPASLETLYAPPVAPVDAVKHVKHK